MVQQKDMITPAEVEKLNEAIGELLLELDDVCDGWSMQIVMAALAAMVAQGIYKHAYEVERKMSVDEQIEKHVKLIRIFLAKAKH